MPDNIKPQLNSFLSKAKLELSILQKTQNPEDARTSVKVIIEQCLSILDFGFNHYSNVKGTYFFPRPTKRNAKLYKKEIETRIVQSKNQGNIKLDEFLRKCLQIVKSNNWALQYLHSYTKHHKTEDINIKNKTHYEYVGIGDKPTINKEGLLVPGVGFFSKGSSVVMIGCISTGPGHRNIIENLKYSQIEISGGYISFNDNSVVVRKNLRSWLKNCIKTCEEIIGIII